MNAQPRILVIEDTHELREDLSLELKDAGYEVVEAHDGATALAAFLRHRPELVICDIQLPDMDGLSVIGAIRAEETGGVPTPVIVVSAFSDIYLRSKAEEFAIASFILKPVDYASLLTLMAECVAGAGAAAVDK
jgi:DNA-binding response OmpR family regulator